MNDLEYQHELSSLATEYINSVRSLTDNFVIKRLSENKIILARSLECLSETETKILGLILDGLSNKEIAWSVNRSERTIKFHVSNILRKHHVQDRRRLVEVIRIRELG